MANNTILTDGLGHLCAGIVISILDYVTYRAANPTEDRVSQRRACLESMERVLDDSTLAGSRNEADYASHVETVHAYLTEQGLIKAGLPPIERLRNLFRSLFKRERINNLSALQKLAFALVMEVFYDSLFGFRFYTQVLQESPLAALSRNLYQVPALWVGLWGGSLLRKFLHWISTSSEEKELDRTIRDLLEETDIVATVVRYEPPSEIETTLHRYASQATRAGRKFLDSAKEAAGSVTDYARSMAEKDDREAREEEERRQRFDDLRKGR